MCRYAIISWLVLSFFFVVSTSAQQAVAPSPAAGKKSQQQDERRAANPGTDMGAILVKGLKNTDGCIEVKTCQWSDGKRSIVAWFENKDAAATWYYSDTHQAIITGKTDGSKTDDEPMIHIKDEDQPIMVIASLTPAARPELPGIEIPISQISIELFAPLPGGAQVGGRVSPAAFKVPHMRDYTSPTKKSIEDKRQSNGN